MTTIIHDKFPLLDLPENVLSNVYAHLSPKDLDNLSKIGNPYLYSITLENEPWRKIAQKLQCPPANPQAIDLSRLSRFCQSIPSMISENTLWKSIANKIESFSTKKTTSIPRQQVREYVLNLKADIKNLQSTVEFLPRDILSIVESNKMPSFEEIKLLKDYRKARDTLIVWQHLAQKYPSESPPLRDRNTNARFSIKTSDELFNKVKEFDQWCTKNRDKLAAITDLDLMGQDLSMLPEQIGLLTNLTTLHLNNNRLVKLPSTLGQLTQLKGLSLRENKLSILPDEFSQLTSLEDLSLSNNNFSEFPSQLLELQKLEELYLSDNHISILPKEITKLSNLKRLSLDHNKLSTLPSQFANLKKIFHLGLDDNIFSSFPTEITELPQLRIFCISRNKISSIPTEIAKLTELHYFDLGHNKISGIPREIIPFLIQLAFIGLDSNRFSEFPSQIWEKTRISNSISFRNNPFSLMTRLNYRERMYGAAQIRAIKKIAGLVASGCAVSGIGYMAFQYSNEIISSLGNSLPYVGAIATAVAIQKLVHRYF